MKKFIGILFIQLFSFLMLLSFSSCKKTNSEIALNKQLSPKDFAIAGIEHNKILESVYQALKAKNKNDRSGHRTSYASLDDALMISEQIIIDDVDSYNYSNESEQLAHLLIDNIYNNIPVMSDGNLYNAQVASNLSSDQIQMIDELNVVMSDDDYSLASLQSRINNIESQVPALNLTEDQQSVVYSATSIAKYTLEYWNANFDNWVALNTNLGGRVNRSLGFSWKQVGKNDVAGGIGGAVATGIARFFGPVGWGVWGAGILGGAAGASAYDAIMQLW